MFSLVILVFAFVLPVNAEMRSVDAYAEGIYSEYAAAADGGVQLQVSTIKTGSLADISDVSFGNLIEVSDYVIQASQFGTHFRNAQLVAATEKNQDLSDLKANALQLESLGLPVELGTYRLLWVDVSVNDVVNRHQAMEMCWSSLGHCVVLDPSIPFLQSMVDNRLRLLADGWGPRITPLRDSSAIGRLDKAYCGVASHPSWGGIQYTWYGYWVEYKNVFGSVLVRKDLGEQVSGLVCDSNCYPNPFGHSYSSSCYGNIGYRCACDNAFGYGESGRTGKWISETKCTHALFGSVVADVSVSDMGSINVRLNWDLAGGVDSNGGECLDTCMWF
jgi:hypothetical protein